MALSNDGTIGAVAEPQAATLLVVSSIDTRNKYLSGPQVVVAGVAVCVCESIGMSEIAR